MQARVQKSRCVFFILFYSSHINLSSPSFSLNGKKAQRSFLFPFLSPFQCYFGLELLSRYLTCLLVQSFRNFLNIRDCMLGPSFIFMISLLILTSAFWLGANFKKRKWRERVNQSIQCVIGRVSFFDEISGKGHENTSEKESFKIFYCIFNSVNLSFLFSPAYAALFGVFCPSCKCKFS